MGHVIGGGEVCETWLLFSLAGCSPRRPDFDPTAVSVGLLEENVASRQVFLHAI
jgi:hypothetical protein